MLRAIEHALEPVLTFERPALDPPLPPSGSWDTVRLINLVAVKVKVARWEDSQIKPPPEMLPALLAILRRTLVRMSELFEEADQASAEPRACIIRESRGNLIAMAARTACSSSSRRSSIH